MYNLKAIAALAACGAATANAAAFQPRQYKTLVSSVGYFLSDSPLLN
jgi:hypothetical protein